jgi:hypothetical protein
MAYTGLPAHAQDAPAPRDMLVVVKSGASAQASADAARQQADKARAAADIARTEAVQRGGQALTLAQAGTNKLVRVLAAKPSVTVGPVAATAPLTATLDRSVKNAPYSAQVVSEQVQTLGDGNQISNRIVTHSFRDSQGRIRMEVPNAQGQLAMVTLLDPEARTSVLLDPEKKRATRVAVPASPPRVTVMSSAKRTSQGPERSMVPNADGAAVQRIEQRMVMHPVGSEPVTVSFRGSAGGAPQANLLLGERLGPLISTAMTDRKWAAMATTRDLGTREMEGVKVKGNLVSYEIPAGEIGNRHPIVVSREEWFSPDLNILVHARHSDPRSGERIYRLEGITREEPPASLFAIPADYSVRDLDRPHVERLDAIRRPGHPEKPEGPEKPE